MALKPGHVTLGESELLELVRTQPVPRHVAVIMDGNGRWATQRGLPRVAGHSEGVKSARTVVRTADTLGVGYLTLYAFSSENWSRPSEEVATLMSLLERSIHQELRSEEHTSELQSPCNLVCRLLLEKKKKKLY